MIKLALQIFKGLAGNPSAGGGCPDAQLQDKETQKQDQADSPEGVHKKITRKITAVKKGLQGQPAAVAQETDGGQVKKGLQDKTAELGG